MQYHEFLRIAGTNEDVCPPEAYAMIELAYMENDDLFPSKRSVVAYWKSFGVIGFTRDYLLRLRTAIEALRNCCYYPNSRRRMATEGVEAWVVRAANRSR